MPGFNRIADPVSQGLGQVAEDINEWGLSDYQKSQNQAFQEAIANSAAQLGEGASVSDHLANIKNQGGAAGQFILENPSQALSLTAESLPYLFGGSGVARILGKLAPTMGVGTRAAIGEGTVAAGASTQQIVGDLQDQGVTGWTPERLYGAAAGLGTAGIGRLGAKLQGPVDVDTLLAGKVGNLGKAPNAAIGAAKGAGFEAAEELLQGAQEEAFGNLATGRPISENVGSSAIAGSIAGGGIGGLAGAFAGMASSSATRNQSPLAPPAPAQATADPAAPAQGQQQAAAANQGDGYENSAALEGELSPFIQPAPSFPIGAAASGLPISPDGLPFSPVQAPANDVPTTPSNNTPQEGPGSPVTDGTAEAIPSPTPTTQGNTAAPPAGSEASKIPVGDTFAPNKRPKAAAKPVAKPKAPAKTKAKKAAPKKGKAITDFPSTDPTTQEEVKKLEALVTLAKEARKNKDKALLEETQKAIRAQKVYVSKALRDSYKGQTKAEKEAAKPERKGKEAWLAISNGKMVMSKGRSAPKDSDVYVRADNKPGPKVHIDKTKRTKAEQAVEDKILDGLLNYTGLDGKMPIYIYRQNPRQYSRATRKKHFKETGRTDLNPGSLTPGAGGKAVAVNIYIEDYLLAADVKPGFDIDKAIEETLAHEIGVHGVMRLGGDKDIGKVGTKSGPWPDFWNNVYEENKEAIRLWIKEGGGGGYRGVANGLKAEEWFAAKLQGEISDIAEGRAQTYSAKVKRYLRQVQAYLDSITGKKYTFDQVAEMLVDAAERTVFSTDQTWTGKELWSESKDGVFYVDDVHEWKSREPNSPAATDELYSLIEVGGAKPGYPDKGDNNYAFGAWSGSYLKGVSSWAWGGATKAMVMDGDLNPKEMGELFGKNVHSAFGYLHSKLSGVQGMDLEVAYERPNVGAKKFKGRGRPSVYAKIRRRSDPSVFFQVRVADHVSDLGEKIRTDGPVTIEFANAHLEQFDQSWKDRIDLALDMLRDDGVYKMSPLQAAIDYDINDGFTIKPLSETAITKHGNPKNASGSELRTITKGKGKLLFERPGVPVPKDLARYGEKDRLELGTFTYQEFLDGHSVSKKMLEGVYFAEVNKGVRKSVTLPDPMDTVELNSLSEVNSSKVAQSEREESTQEYKDTWDTPEKLFDKKSLQALLTGKGDFIPKKIRDDVKKQLFGWNDYLITKSKGRIDLTALSITGLGGLKDQDSYLKDRYKMMGDLKKVEKLAKEIYETFNKFSKSNPDYNSAIFDYLTGGTTDGKGMSAQEQRAANERELRQRIKDESVVQLAIKLKKKINSNAKQAVELGLLKSDHPTDGDQNYLPRLYLKHLMETEDYKILAGGGGRISTRGYSKKRKDLGDATRAYLGEVKDAAFLGASTISQVGRDISIASFLQQISDKNWGEDNNWVMPGSVVNISLFKGGGSRSPQTIEVREVNKGAGKAVSVQWLIDEAKRIRERSAQTKDADAKKMAEQVADQLEALYKKKMGELETKEEFYKRKKQYRQVPISSRYGVLSGMYINKRIYNDLFSDGSFSDNKYYRLAEQYHAYWKIAKVPLNPPTIFRNIMSNMVLQTLDGMPPHKMMQYNVRALNDLWKVYKKGAPKTEAMKVGDKYGLGSETFASQEMVSIVENFKNEALKNSEDNKNPFKLALAFTKDKTMDATKLYGGVEVWQKLAVIQYHLDQGADGWTAFKHAQDTMFDYSLLSSAGKKFRRSPIGAPFLSFTLLATRRLGQVIATNPGRLFWWYAVSQVLWWGMAKFEGVDEEDLEELHKALPSYLADKPSFFLLPVPGRDEEGRMRFYDFSYTHPFGGLLEMAKNTSKGEIDKVMEMVGIGGAPALQMIMALYTGEDPFTKQDITSEEFTVKEKLWDRTKFVYRHTFPSLITGQGAIYKMWQAAEFEVPMLGWKKEKAVGGSKLNWGETKTTMPQAVLRLGGINLYSVDPGQTAQKNMMILTYRMSDLDAAYRRKLREAVANNREKAIEKITATWKMQKEQLAQEMEAMAKLQDVHPNLKIKDIKK